MLCYFCIINYILTFLTWNSMKSNIALYFNNNLQKKESEYFNSLVN